MRGKAGKKGEWNKKGEHKVRPYRGQDGWDRGVGREPCVRPPSFAWIIPPPLETHREEA